MITFIDVFSRKTWVYLFKEKSYALEKFKELKTIVKKQRGYPIKVLQSDRREKYITKAFDDIYKGYGKVYQLTTVCTPQQNGVSERKNMTILNMREAYRKQRTCQIAIRSMLSLHWSIFLTYVPPRMLSLRHRVKHGVNTSPMSVISNYSVVCTWRN